MRDALHPDGHPQSARSRLQRRLPGAEPDAQLRRPGAADAGPAAGLNDVPVQIEWQDGYLLPPTRPGLGIEFDREALRRLPKTPPMASRRLQRADGSYTNW